MQESHPDATIFFLYVNDPCVVIGRNQNPWREANLHLIGSSTHDSSIGKVELIRRRSGGGTVFHDKGNINWSVTCNPSGFTRDKHAEMIVRALHQLGVSRARVNERHDIVLDPAAPAAGPPLKISGSAYKLTRTRALHHGTCLLASPNLGAIPQYLRSPAKAFLQSRGVESVSSPIANVGVTMADFQVQALSEFGHMCGSTGGKVKPILVGSDLLDVREIANGVKELKVSSPSSLCNYRFPFRLDRGSWC